MPVVSKSHPVAIACADLHLSHKPPAARAGEEWYSAMGRVADELVKLKLEYKVPILCAGDVFHAHNPPPELINWAIGNLPEMYAIPGQHDLPYHRYEDIRKSAYWTLVQAEVLVHVDGWVEPVGGVRVYGFGWGRDVTPPSTSADTLDIALVHEYMWNTNDSRYHGASETQRLSNNPGRFEGYDVVVVGDNHISWDATTSLSTNQITRFFNCGSLMRRNADQQLHLPRVGIIMSDGSVKSHYLDTSKDKLASGTPSEVEADGTDAPSFAEVMDGLRGLGGAALDFPTLCRQAMERRGTDPRVARYLLEALEHGEGTGPQTR